MHLVLSRQQFIISRISRKHFISNRLKPAFICKTIYHIIILNIQKISIMRCCGLKFTGRNDKTVRLHSSNLYAYYKTIRLVIEYANFTKRIIIYNVIYILGNNPVICLDNRFIETFPNMADDYDTFQRSSDRKSPCKMQAELIALAFHKYHLLIRSVQHAAVCT